jgi:hypothetical protein
MAAAAGGDSRAAGRHSLRHRVRRGGEGRRRGGEHHEGGDCEHAFHIDFSVDGLGRSLGSTTQRGGGLGGLIVSPSGRSAKGGALSSAYLSAGCESVAPLGKIARHTKGQSAPQAGDVGIFPWQGAVADMAADGCAVWAQVTVAVRNMATNPSANARAPR